MRGDPEEIIIRALKDDPKTAHELLSACKDQGLEGKTYYRALNRLKGEKIKDAKYVLIQEEEANREEVEDVIRRLSESDNQTLLSTISEELIRFTDRKRSATIPNFLHFLESALVDPKFSDPKILVNIINALRSMLSYEQRRHKPDEGIIRRITKNVSRITEISKKYSDRRVLGEALLFLCATESEIAVSAIFDLVKNLDEKHYNEVESGFEMALVGTDSKLYDKFHSQINDFLYDLIESENQILKDRAMKLQKKKIHWRR